MDKNTSILKLPNYHFHEILSEGSRTIMYRGVRASDNQSIIAKILRKTHPPETELDWLEYEYQIVSKLNLDCIAEMYGLENVGSSKVLLMEDFGAVSLDTYIKNRQLDIETFLNIAIPLTKAVGKIHLHDTIHKDLKPANIFLNTDTFELKLTGFGISAQLSRESQQVVDQDLLEGTPAYISPEQTGRINRSVDYRSDFYSLGAIFYEMLTGTPPFTADTRSELIYSQIAKQPVPPAKKRPDIPVVLNNIILKLLSKSPENRYQSSRGLLTDLLRCQNDFLTEKTISSFAIAENDLPERFNPPEKLYGREKEIRILNNTFSKVCQGATRMLLIEGPPGIGKTFLIQEIQKPLVARKGFFISGKFDQYKGNTPYEPVVRAFQVLIKHLLTLSQTELEEWKTRLNAALSPNSKVIVDVIPELESIIGSPPPVLVLAPTEALNRFNLTFQKFIRVFARADHPLVLFIDDWQWADTATLGLLYSLMTDDEISHLFFIGAYRDTEVSGNHPFMIKLEEIHQYRQSIMATLHLHPLSLDNITYFLRDALHSELAKVEPLARLVHRKTRGNPFFIKQFTQILYKEGFLWFDREMGLWSWDLDRAEGMEAAENVVELMLHQFQNLPQESRHELQLASCIGNQFDIETLATISNSLPAQSFNNLRSVVEQGYLLPLDNTYKLFLLNKDVEKSAKVTLRFAHDKIQQAAYDLAAVDERKPIHLTIGRMLLQKYGETGLNAKVFDVVDQFNHALELVSNEVEKETLVRLNLTAALKAKNSAAYQSASDYLKKGCALLPKNAWQKNYKTTRDLYRERAEVEYLVGNFENSEKIIDYLLDNVETDIEKAEIYNIYIIQKTMSADFQEAIATGKKALRLLDIVLPEEDPEQAFTEELDETYRNLDNKSIADLIHEPDMKDERRRLQIKVLTNICSPAYRSDQALFRILVLKAVNITLKHGLVAEACYTLSSYGLLRGSILGDFEIGYQFGLLGRKISEKYQNLTQDCRANFILSSTLIHWVKHARECDAASDRCYNRGLDSGEFQFAGYILTYKLTNLIFQGKNLTTLRETAHNYLEFHKKTKNRWATDMILGTQMIFAYLLGLSDKKAPFYHEGKAEIDFYVSCKEISNYSALSRYYIFKALALYIMGEYREARAAIEEAEKRISFLFGTIYSAEYVFADSLTLAGLLDLGQYDEGHIARIHANQEKMKAWADSAPENFYHRYLLIEAELTKHGDTPLDAVEYYDQAIGHAAQGGFVQNEALANEMAGRFWLGRKKKEFALLYFGKAYSCYLRWGASRKLEQMQISYPELHRGIPLIPSLVEEESQADETVTLEQLDIDMLIKALQAISGEIILENLLDKLMTFVIMNAGADRGVLFIRKKELFYLEAEIQAGEQSSTLLQAIPLEESRTPLSLIRYVARTQETVVIDDARGDTLLEQDEYVQKTSPISILCMPIIRQQQLNAILYLENKSAAQVFTPRLRKILSLLGAQVAISLENATLFEEINREVIERRRAEEALRQSEERFRELADLLPQIIFEANADGLLTFLNRHGFSSLGISKEKFAKGLKTTDVIIPGDHEKLARNIKDILEGCTPRGNSYHLKRFDGSTFPVLAYSSRIIQNGKVSGFRGIILDVTELKKTEADLKNTQNYLNNLFNTLPSILLSVDGETKVQKWNKAATAFTGLKFGAVVGRSLWKCLPILLPFRNKLSQALQTGNAVELYKQKVLPDMETYLDIFFYPLSYEGEKGAVIRIDDVTELVNIDRQLHHAQKMEIIGSLAGGLAHDFNNLLSGITGTLSLIKAQSAMGQTLSIEKLDNYVHTMETASNRAAGLVKQLQTLSKKQPLTLSIFDLDNAVQNVVKFCRNIIDKSIDIVANCTASSSMVEADQGQIEQVLLNICINAAHAMTIMRDPSEKQGGVLSLIVEDAAQDSAPSSGTSNHFKMPSLRLSIRDTGIGMDASTLGRIFDPFFTSKETGVGTGLGLAMAYNIIKQHGGVIEVHSTPGIGTTFNIFLPKSETLTSPSPPETSRVKLAKGSGCILVIDDEEIVLTTTRELLEALGYQVIVALSGDKGIEKYKENKETIKAVLLDMAMPKKSGKEVFLELKKIDENIKVILSSGFRHDRRVEETMQLGVQGFIQKPYSMEQLMIAMEKVIGAGEADHAERG